MLADSLELSPGLILPQLNYSPLSLQPSIEHAICRGTIALLWFSPALHDTGWLAGVGVAELRGVSSCTCVEARGQCMKALWIVQHPVSWFIGLYYQGSTPSNHRS
jgi:hypothetical protein